MRRDPRDVLMWNYGSICCWRRTQKTISTLGLRFYFFLFPPFLFCVVVVDAGFDSGRLGAFTAGECGWKFNLTCLDCSHNVYTRAHQTPDTELFNYTCAFSVSMNSSGGRRFRSGRHKTNYFHSLCVHGTVWLGEQQPSWIGTDWLSNEHTARHCTAIPCLSN